MAALCLLASPAPARAQTSDPTLSARRAQAERLRRVAWGELGSLMIVSGAFGVFRKDVLVEVGGFRHD